MLSFLLNPLAVIVSLSTATGVLLHDTHLDKATATVMALPTITASYEPGSKPVNLVGDLHVHPERASFSHPLGDLKLGEPRIQPRAHEDKRHMLQKHVRRGYHAFDAYYIPL